MGSASWNVKLLVASVSNYLGLLMFHSYQESCLVNVAGMGGNHQPDFVEFLWNKVHQRSSKPFSSDELRYVSVVDDAALQADLSGALSTLLEADYDGRWKHGIQTIYSDLRLAHPR